MTKAIRRPFGQWLFSPMNILRRSSNEQFSTGLAGLTMIARDCSAPAPLKLGGPRINNAANTGRTPGINTIERRRIAVLLESKGKLKLQSVHGWLLPENEMIIL